MNKLYVIVSGEVTLSAGKICSQVVHAVLGCIRKLSPPVKNRWENEGETIVVLKGGDLVSLKLEAENLGLSTCLVRDAGKTEIESGTITCLAIGPGDNEKIVAQLPLL